MKATKILSAISAALFAMAMYAQSYSTAATRAYCDRNRQLAMVDMSGILSTNIPSVVSQQVNSTFGPTVTNIVEDMLSGAATDLNTFMLVTNGVLFIFHDNVLIWQSNQ